MKRRTLLKAALGGAALGAGAWWVARERLQEFSTAGIAFGTTVALRVLHDDEGSARAALNEAMRAVQDVDRLMSLYRPDSQLSVLNRDGRLIDPDARLVAVLREAQALSAATDGAFDVTVQPLWLAATGQGNAASELHRVDWRKLQVTDKALHMTSGMAVTLNGIAQGYGVDVALATLRSHGIAQALLDTGEFGTLGARDDGQPWTLAIRDPRDAQGIAHLLAADGRCLATSGDYGTAFSRDFSHHHIVDPKTGASPQELASVSVLAPTGMQADALSPAFMVMGTDNALRLAQALPGVDALCIGKDGRMRRSEGFPSLPKAV